MASGFILELRLFNGGNARSLVEEAGGVDIFGFHVDDFLVAVRLCEADGKDLDCQHLSCQPKLEVR